MNRAWQSYSIMIENKQEHRQKIFQELKKKGVLKDYIQAEYNIGFTVNDISETHNISQEKVENIITSDSDEGVPKDPTKTDLIPHLEGDDKRFNL
jgi:dTDP-4-amino-4,6-dideoxygalactose transaminase